MRRAGRILLGGWLGSLAACACGSRASVHGPDAANEDGDAGEETVMGGRITSGRLTGGHPATGGDSMGGVSAGGTSTGGVSTGGTSTGGVSTGGTSTGGATGEPLRGCNAYGRVVRGDACAECRAKADPECFPYLERDLPVVCPGAVACARRHCVYGCEPDKCEEDTCACISDCVSPTEGECRLGWEKVMRCYETHCADVCPASSP